MNVVRTLQLRCRYIKAKDFDMAIRVACLGVTEADWKMLGLQALYNMEVDIARESFLRINNLHLVTLSSKVEKDLKDPNRPREVRRLVPGLPWQAAAYFCGGDACSRGRDRVGGVWCLSAQFECRCCVCGGAPGHDQRTQ